MTDLDVRKGRELYELDYIAKAAELWAAFTDNERTAVRFGMFPAVPLRAAEANGFNFRDLCLALCVIAKANGGMRA